MSENILNIPNAINSHSIFEPISYEDFRGTDIPVVIDNGATTMRWGFASSSVPRCQPNIIAKYKERKSNRPLLLFGNSVELEGGAKAQTKTPWEGDVLLNFDALVSEHRLCMATKYERHVIRNPLLTTFSLIWVSMRMLSPTQFSCLNDSRLPPILARVSLPFSYMKIAHLFHLQ